MFDTVGVGREVQTAKLTTVPRRYDVRSEQTLRTYNCNEEEDLGIHWAFQAMKYNMLTRLWT